MSKIKKNKLNSIWNRRERFSIRKFTFGVASCFIGATIALSSLATEQQAEAKSTTLTDSRGDKRLIYANWHNNPLNVEFFGQRGQVNELINIEADWSGYSQDNPYVTITYRFNHNGQRGKGIDWGARRPDFWWTIPLETSNPHSLIFKDGQDLTSWKRFSFPSRGVYSRFQAPGQETASNKVGDPNNAQAYNEYNGDVVRDGTLNDSFAHRVGAWDRDSDTQAWEAFKSNTRTMYHSWEPAGLQGYTVVVRVKVNDPLNSQGKVLQFGAGSHIPMGNINHVNIFSTHVPVLYRKADLFEPTTPADRLEVVNPQSLTDGEKNALRDKIWEANRDNVNSKITDEQNKRLLHNIQGNTEAEKKQSISVTNRGNVTITYDDGSSDFIAGRDLVVKKEAGNNTAVPQNNLITNGTFKYYIDPLEVDNINNVSKEQWQTARERFLKANAKDWSKVPTDTEAITKGNAKDGVAFNWDKYYGGAKGVMFILENNNYSQLKPESEGAGQYDERIPKEHLYKQKESGFVHKELINILSIHWK